ncbi:sigma-70 family RNA polymerase sigma factor [Phytohabitans sp. ZYX-F-186]|uniref:Sigma-70 family RNA polymerase sigma factor n=1 Tax=Phytohabitans maris TaxID=3071409 RepID=A0ABU0ZQH2_9ACTN|nr:sigma-70 family RNA polymerase sigma factor [Phytohabitans sp. ZYX-F-186]MDQ7909284.1 sigma-70 family RNA polymerase sigma factor [Phytohabitans sp. ZYX-F-186]
MSRTGRATPDAALVSAAQQGGAQALDALVAASLPLVYNIVGRALRGHADVDDVVQETLVRVVRHLPDLRDPGAYRPWLVAITIRQVRDWELHRRTTPARPVGVEAMHDVPDPGPDFADLTIARLGLTDQRREVAEATRWLDADDQELIALWWLEEAGELERSDLAGALGLSPNHAGVRIHRMKEQIQTARTVVRALRARPACTALRSVAASWNGKPDSLWRKRLARHVRDCGTCAPTSGDLVPIDRLLAGISMLPVPAALAGKLSGPAALAAKAGAATAKVAAAAGTGSGLAVPVTAAATVVVLVTATLIGVKLNRSPSPEPAANPLPAAVAPAASPTPAPATTRPPATPTPTPKARSTTRAPAAPPAATSPKKGVAVWNFNGVSQALASSTASWYYTWNPRHEGVTTPRGAQFVPMIWGTKDVNDSALAAAKAAGPYLLAFNEPDMGGQADMSVEQALDLWPRLQATGSKLSSPAVAFGGADPGGWLDRFMSGAKSRGYRVDFVALHWYGGDFDTSNAVDQLRRYLRAVYDRYGKPIWLTEFALIDFSGGGARFPSQAQQAAFVTAAAKMLGGLSFLHRYAWFGLPATDKDQSGLFRTGTTPTAVGRAFVAAR